MPAMTPEVRADIEVRLSRFLEGREGYSSPVYVNSGGSAALYRVDAPDGIRAIKVYDPAFLAGTGSVAEKRRLQLQRSLIGHHCPTLVQIFSVEEAEGTAFIEMEFIAWPQLKEVLGTVPDSSIPSLIRQLVDAVIYLEKLEIVHRDIKPENIHVSPDFQLLKLIDLGVARELELTEEEGASATDHGAVRPFIATAQYSSPEYLFRLDAPSPNLWKGLSLYQVGAVLHDLITKVPLFHQEVGLANRWLVARAVLSRVPNFPDNDPARLSSFKALATRCLSKDLTTRLSLVDWADFDFEGSVDPLSGLRARLAKNHGAAGVQAQAANDARLAFERAEFTKRFCELIRSELIPVCTNKIPFLLRASRANPVTEYVFEFPLGHGFQVRCRLYFDWQGELQKKSANIRASAVLIDGSHGLPELTQHLIGVATINEAEETVAHDVACSLAEALSQALDLIEAAVDKNALDGTDVGALAL